MARIGFVGLGTMGLPMAINLLDAGNEVIGHNRSVGRMKALQERGGQTAASPADAARRCEAIITCLPDSADVEEVALGREGVLSGASEGTLYIDMSTIDPKTTRSVAAVAALRGIRFLDAPVSGGQEGASDGTLSIMVGGTREDFDFAMPLFTAMGKTIVHVGPVGAGQIVKAANQILVGGTIQLVSEAIVFLEAHGIETEPALDALGGGLAGNQIITRKAVSMLTRQFEPGFRVDLHLKDLRIALTAARDQGLFVPVAELVGQLMTGLRGLGRGGLDHTALLTLIEELSGRGEEKRAADPSGGR